MKEEKKQYRTNCRDLEVLMWESKLVETPFEDPNFITFDPVVGDLALAGGKEYEFNGKEWLEVVTAE